MQNSGRRGGFADYARRVTDLEQSRLLATEIPGPRSIELTKRKAAAVSHGIGTTMPVYAARAGGGIVEDVDGNRLIDLGSGIAVTTIGNAVAARRRRGARQVADFTHTCFMITPYEEYVAVAEQLNRLTPGSGEKRSALFNSGVGGGRERRSRSPARTPASRRSWRSTTPTTAAPT